MVRPKRSGIFWASVLLMALAGCQSKAPLSPDELLKELPRIARQRYQATVSCRVVGQTLWVYLPYVPPGRFGESGFKEKENDLLLEYSIASFNPYRTVQPPELKFVVQKLLGDIRQLQLRCTKPYTFFVLVVSDITPVETRYPPPIDEWHIGYFNDIKHFLVGKDFQGEGYARLTWHQEVVRDKFIAKGLEWWAASWDAKGAHVPAREITLKEFVEKQIKWRIRKRFTIEYHTVPFDLSAQERKDAIIGIVKHTLSAYNFKGFDTIYLKDSSFLEEEEEFHGLPREEIERTPERGITRKPAF